MQHCSQSGWSEEQPQESSPSAWDAAACVGSKVRSGQTAAPPQEPEMIEMWRRKVPMSVFMCQPVTDVVEVN